MHPVDQVTRFHNAFRVPIGGSYRIDLRRDLIAEEWGELARALVALKDDPKSPQLRADALKEACDLCFVTFGMMVEMFGAASAKGAFDRVYYSNMSKLGDDGEPLFREDGKVLKGSQYDPAVLSDLVDGDVV